MISSPDADQPFMTAINTDTQTVIGQVNWVDTNGQPAGGNEACAYDHGTHSFLVNNDNTVANPRGEIDVIPASSITQLIAWPPLPRSRRNPCRASQPAVRHRHLAPSRFRRGTRASASERA